jgi:hypothetical protein
MAHGIDNLCVTHLLFRVARGYSISFKWRIFGQGVTTERPHRKQGRGKRGSTRGISRPAEAFAVPGPGVKVSGGSLYRQYSPTISEAGRCINSYRCRTPKSLKVDRIGGGQRCQEDVIGIKCRLSRVMFICSSCFSLKRSFVDVALCRCPFLFSVYLLQEPALLTSFTRITWRVS